MKNRKKLLFLNKESISKLTNRDYILGGTAQNDTDSFENTAICTNNCTAGCGIDTVTSPDNLTRGPRCLSENTCVMNTQMEVCFA